MYVTIVDWGQGDRVTKYATFDTVQEANDHRDAHGGFVVQDPPGPPMSWVANPGAQTVASVPQVSIQDIISERERRLAAGFDYDFGDERGVHRIATTKADMEGWDEVAKLAAALVAVGDTTTLISIMTETGAAQITSLEWSQIALAAAQFRQPIWAASFALQAMDPIPGDYDDDGYWS